MSWTRLNWLNMQVRQHVRNLVTSRDTSPSAEYYFRGKVNTIAMHGLLGNNPKVIDKINDGTVTPAQLESYAKCVLEKTANLANPERYSENFPHSFTDDQISQQKVATSSLTGTSKNALLDDFRTFFPTSFIALGCRNEHKVFFRWIGLIMNGNFSPFCNTFRCVRR